jgi:hypothetical protein
MMKKQQPLDNQPFQGVEILLYHHRSAPEIVVFLLSAE